MWWCILPHPPQNQEQAQEFLLGLSICAIRWVLRHPLAVPGTAAWLKWELHGGEGITTQPLRTWKHPLPDPWPEGNSTIAGVWKLQQFKLRMNLFQISKRQSSSDPMDSGPEGCPWSFPAPQQAETESLQTPKVCDTGRTAASHL